MLLFKIYRVFAFSCHFDNEDFDSLSCLQMTQLLLVHTIILFSQANIELTKLYNWFCLNKLYLNIDKTS